MLTHFVCNSLKRCGEVTRKRSKVQLGHADGHGATSWTFASSLPFFFLCCINKQCWLSFRQDGKRSNTGSQSFLATRRWNLLHVQCAESLTWADASQIGTFGVWQVKQKLVQMYAWHSAFQSYRLRQLQSLNPVRNIVKGRVRKHQLLSLLSLLFPHLGCQHTPLLQLPHELIVFHSSYPTNN